MTILVGLVDKENEQVILASDRTASMGSHLLHAPVVKIIDFDFMALAGCGAVRGLNIIEAHLSPPVPMQGEDAYHYCITQLVPALQDTFRAANYSDHSASGGTQNMHNGLLVAIDGRLFEIGEDFAVIEYQDFACAGSGMLYAYGALHACEAIGSDITFEDKLICAIHAAARFDAACGDDIAYVVKGKLNFVEVKQKAVGLIAEAQKKEIEEKPEKPAKKTGGKPTKPTKKATVINLSNGVK